VIYPSRQHASEVQYSYDDLGRLTAVIDDAGNTAIYNYDAVGNLLGIDRFTPGASGIGVYAVLPGKGAVGAQVKVQGHGFDPTPSNNTVTFNGTGATVVSSTAYAIIATVPASATTGTVAVTNTNGSANSPQAFTVLGAPTITSVTPNSVAQGTQRSMTIAGTQLVNATAVGFTQSGLSATILTGVTATSLPVKLVVAPTVPPGTYTFTVTTPEGTANSGTVTISVAAPAPSFALTYSHVSVAMPVPSVSPTAAPSGRTMTVGPPTSAWMAYPDVPSTSAPTGRSMTVAPPVSEAMP
jgi:YD repeat-containing protein